MPMQPPVTPEVVERIVPALQSPLPGLLAIYGFGSRVQGTAGPESDLDLAVLVEGYADPLQRWWARDAQAALFESAILSEKTALDMARAGLLTDIQERGSVYGG